MNFNDFARHPAVAVIGFFVAAITSYDLIVGSMMSEKIDSLEGEVRAQDIKINSLTGEIRVLEGAKADLKAQLNQSIQLRNIEQITQNAALMVAEIYNREQSDYEIVPKTYKDNEIIQTDFYILEESVEFTSGNYTLEKAYESSKFVDAVTTFVVTMDKIYKQHKLSSSYHFDALFEGGADKVHTNQKFVGRYNGEYGTIHAENVLVNGRNRAIILRPNDLVGNSELAFLRSYSVYMAYRKLAKKLPDDIRKGNVQFVANESPLSGKKHRYGKITVRIKDQFKASNSTL